ncbi:hypothetical protein BUALT_Bualt14G0051800 [Buddleja alternifolia]|uniref:Uncharacterized protein n=1 Tax=Buddleja alternifolia TaxID=168488 RepID=A0AAV6WSA5_9LAMI|nr:hypothetical protein BUALT_Bualt14G0051800 [Buddleja alternifolia]
MAAASSATNSQSSTNNPPLVKQEQPQDVSSEIMESKEVKREAVEDSKDVKKETKEEPIRLHDPSPRYKQLLGHRKKLILFSTIAGNIFDTKTNIDGQTTTASRLPPYQSFLDPATFEKLISKDSGSSAETPTTSTSNGKPST